MKRIAAGLAFAGATAVALADFATGFELPAYSGSAAGTVLTGQNGWYLPAGSVDYSVYAYAGNVNGIAANPTGGLHFIGGVSEGNPFARAQINTDFSTNDVYVLSYDFLGVYLGFPPTAQNLGSFSV